MTQPGMQEGGGKNNWEAQYKCTKKNSYITGRHNEQSCWCSHIGERGEVQAIKASMTPIRRLAVPHT